MKSFENYLTQNGHTKSTVRSYSLALKLFMRRFKQPENLNYKDIIDYLATLKCNGSVQGKKENQLYSLKKYYDYLIAHGLRDTHPCKQLHLRVLKRRSIIHHDLFSSKELESLLNRHERYSMLAKRNKLVISLLIFQGLTSSEISVLKLKDINMKTGQIIIRSSRRVNKRVLLLNSFQLELFNDYLAGSRKQLCKKEDGSLIIGNRGNRICIEDIHYLISTYKLSFPDRKLTSVTIRQSVIANWLNEKKIPLEQVQLMAGQKWISSTLRYRQDDYNKQREMIERWFPI